MILSAGAVSPTPPGLSDVEQQLRTSLGAAEIVWCGRGASALCLAYRLAGLVEPSCPSPEVILPAIGCASLVSTAFVAGMKPRFADVNPHTGTVDLDRITRVCGPRTKAALCIHLFGNAMDLSGIRAWTRANGMLLIEDIAHAFGAVLPDGSPAGSVGDLVICSFSPTKLVDCGGGALIVRSSAHAELLLDAVRSLPSPTEPPVESAANLEASYRDMQYGLIALQRALGTSRSAACFAQLQPCYESLWMRPLLNSELLGESLRHYPHTLPERRLKADIYTECLDAGPWQLLDGWRESGVCWRYTLLLQDSTAQLALSEALRRDGFHVSNLYWSLAALFPEQGATPGADEFARRVLNLWVDSSVPPDWVRACAQALLHHSRRVQW